MFTMKELIKAENFESEYMTKYKQAILFRKKIRDKAKQLSLAELLVPKRSTEGK